MWPQRRQPTRLPRPWDSLGKNTGVGCHFLLQCMKVKSEGEVAQSCLTLRDPHGLQPTRFLHPWDFPGKSIGVGCHCLLQLSLLLSVKADIPGSLKWYISQWNQKWKDIRYAFSCYRSPSYSAMMQPGTMLGPEASGGSKDNHPNEDSVKPPNKGLLMCVNSCKERHDTPDWINWWQFRDPFCPVGFHHSNLVLVILYDFNLGNCTVSLVAQAVKCLSTMQETWVRSLGQEDPLEKEMAIYSSTIAWKIPWTEEPGRLQSTGSQRVRHDWAHFLLSFFQRGLDHSTT